MAAPAAAPMIPPATAPPARPVAAPPMMAPAAPPSSAPPSASCAATGCGGITATTIDSASAAVKIRFMCGWSLMPRPTRSQNTGFRRAFQFGAAMGEICRTSGCYDGSHRLRCRLLVARLDRIDGIDELHEGRKRQRRRKHVALRRTDTEFAQVDDLLEALHAL